MLYLKNFKFRNRLSDTTGTISPCYKDVYPYKIFSNYEEFNLSFEPITILYGDNGCGKTTALNIMAEALQLKRTALYNKSSFFESYIGGCSFAKACDIPENSCILTSDDVFDYMLNIRSINAGVDNKREDLFSEYNKLKIEQRRGRSSAAAFRMNSLDDYERIARNNAVRDRTQSSYVQNYLADNIRERSNGESAFYYFTQKIDKEGLYLLDEPENSLSPENQLKLREYLENAARFFNCQFIISTHSPFILSIKYAKIYELGVDDFPVKHWTDLKSMRLYYEFFMENAKRFDKHS